MNDLELLELAAKAAGYEVLGWDAEHNWLNVRQRDCEWGWNPKNDYAEALRLAAELHIDVCWNENEGPWEVNAWPQQNLMGANACPSEYHGGAVEAVCDAILRAAATIGKAMK